MPSLKLTIRRHHGSGMRLTLRLAAMGPGGRDVDRRNGCCVAWKVKMRKYSLVLVGMAYKKIDFIGDMFP